MLQSSLITISQMALDIAQETSTNKGQQALSFLSSKIWTKISYSTKNVKTTASHVLKKEIVGKSCR